MTHEHHSDSPWRPETNAVTAGRPPHVPGAPVNYPIGVSSTFNAGDAAHAYVRGGTVGTEALEHALGLLEGGESIVFGSGLATVNAVLDLLPAGGIVVAPNHAYPGTNGRLRELAAVGRIELREVPIDDASAVAAAAAGAALIWLETPTNPQMEIADLKSAVAVAKSVGALTAVDNTFMSPVRQRPLELGADISMHSATKTIAGHSDALLGSLSTSNAELADQLRLRRTMLGAFPGALETFLGLRGLRTLHLRYDRAEANAQLIAARLAEHPKVELVRYPTLASKHDQQVHFGQATGPGMVVCFEVVGGEAEAERVCTTTRLWTHATSLGGVESTLERRRRWSAESPDVSAGLIRLSVGIEHVEDLWADLAQALG